MWPDRVSNLGPLTYESGALPTALCGPAEKDENIDSELSQHCFSRSGYNKNASAKL